MSYSANDSFNPIPPTEIEIESTSKTSRANIFKPRVFKLEHLGKLLSEPPEVEEWVVEQRMRKSGVSILVGKPKAGKTTLARQLALCVARGESFLGWNTVKGKVLYLALEEIRGEVRNHFATMGAIGDEEIYIHAASAPIKAIESLKPLIAQHLPSLVIIDPLFRFTRFTDGNNYAEVTNALEPIVDLARESKTHLLLVHHMGKGGREGADGILGSTAIFGAVDAAFILSKTERHRKLSSEQRYGEAFEELLLAFDPESRLMTIAGVAEPIQSSISQNILKALTINKTPCTQAELCGAVVGQRSTIIQSIEDLVRQRKVSKVGNGKKGTPFTYSIAVLSSDS